MAYCGCECNNSTKSALESERYEKCENVAVEKIKSIPEQMYALDDRVNVLTELVDELSNRLYPVVTGARPECATAGTNQLVGELTPMADHLRDLGIRIQRQNSIIRDLLLRLEI